MVTRFTLDEQEKDVFELNLINGECFQIPVGRSLTLGEVQAMTNADGSINMEGALAFFRKYIRPEVLDSLTVNTFTAIVNKWAEAPKQSGGLSLGE